MSLIDSGHRQWQNQFMGGNGLDDRRQRSAKILNGFDQKGGSRLSWLANSDSEVISTKRRKNTWFDVSWIFNLQPLWRVLYTGNSTRVRPLTTPTPTAPMLKFCLLCSLWYSSSALSSNTGKAILNQFRYPVTLTFVQFGFVAAYCLIFCSPWVRFTKLRRPNRAILRSTLPMGVFQVGGHIFSSMAISRIPVSTVHTIKALSPLFTVAAYAILFGVGYSTKTYLSLLPLTIGVMLACSFDMSASNALGLLCAFGSAIVFVSSNIFFKKIMPSEESGNTSAHKLDKLNLLFYSSSMAFLLMIPIWVCSDLPIFLSQSTHVSHPSHGHTSPHSVLYHFFLNGTVHFAQNIIAFIILSSTSPVTYSIASLIKRVVVICIAIVWFSQSIHLVQGLGICMTFFGLWMYNSAKGDVEKGEHKMRRVEAARNMLLPSTKADYRMTDPNNFPSLTPSQHVIGPSQEQPLSISTSYTHPAQIPVVAITSPTEHSPQHHRHPHHLKIVPPRSIKSDIIPVTDSYPSPPLSTESPPSTAIPLA